ncbi:MAG: 3-deoxy-D-manno-octulosonic acid transferase [Alphaproteobacteria bacterium]
MTGLALYRGLTGLGAPLIVHLLRRRLNAGKEDSARFPERRGIASRPRPYGPLVWMHAASVGEAQSALSLIARMLRVRTDLHILVTTGTVTSAGILADRLPPRSFHQYVPVDYLPWVRRFLDHWDPDMAVWIESEFWPNLISETASRDIPAILVNGRISRKSVANWQFLPGFIRGIIGNFRLCLAQSDDEADRFRRLGADPVRCVGNLKFSAAALPAEEPELRRLATRVDGRPRWIAASTHPGEEALAAEADRLLRQRYPNLLTIVAPRHPARGPGIAAELGKSGLRVARRAGGDDIEPATDIYVADTLGELGLLYRLADIAFIGGTMDAYGGHNPLEAAQLDCAVLHGPDMANFTTVAQQLARADAAQVVTDAASLAAAVQALLDNPLRRETVARAAADVALANAEVVDRVMEHLQPFIDALPAEEPDARP